MTTTSQSSTVHNGPVAAAILAAGIGCFAMGLIAWTADAHKAIATALIFWRPTGPLSGVSTLAILLWLASWILFSVLWGKISVSLAKVNAAAFILLALGLLLTFPPIGDLLMGK